MECGHVWSDVRDPPTLSPDVCPHRRVDNCGSNKTVRKAYCKDCGVYIDSIAQELAQELEARKVLISAEEQMISDRIVDHSMLTKEQIVTAVDLMKAEIQKRGRQLSDDIGSRAIPRLRRSIARNS